MKGDVLKILLDELSLYFVSLEANFVFLVHGVDVVLNVVILLFGGGQNYLMRDRSNH